MTIAEFMSNQDAWGMTVAVAVAVAFAFTVSERFH